MFVGITNTPRDYAWGSVDAIPSLLGVAPTGAPQAELWLGAHAGSPSQLVGRPGTLADVVSGRLPFLLKVLAAGAPLSLQAHPTMAQAEEGFERENVAGVPLDSPTRNYKDAFHKPELIYALSDEFRALAGFRPVAETREVLSEAALSDARLAPLLTRLVDDSSLRPTFEWIKGGGDEIADVVAGLVAVAASAAAGPAGPVGPVGPSWDTIRTLGAAYPGDPGIATSMLLHSLVLRRGEVLYLPAGNIHAYLSGLGIELMAASDNVLRGGLTPKHVDVPELLSVLDFRPLPAPFLAAEEPEPGVQLFRPDVDDFVLTVVSDAAAERGVDLTLEGGGPAIAFAASGAVVLSAGDDSFALERGAAVYLDSVAQLHVEGDGLVFLASGG